MDKEVFAEWFKEFANAIKERPLLHTFDGHMTYVSLPVIERALQDKIVILKFPPHATTGCFLLWAVETSLGTTSATTSQHICC